MTATAMRVGEPTGAPVCPPGLTPLEPSDPAFGPRSFPWHVHVPFAAASAPKASATTGTYAETRRFEEPASRPSPERVAQRDYRDALRLAEEGRYDMARLKLRAVMSTFPELSDRLTLLDGEWLAAEGRHKEACKAYWSAVEGTPHGSIRARGRVAYVRCLIEAGDARAESSYKLLLQRYPELPEQAQIELAFAQATQSRGRTREAAMRFRAIDVQFPGTAEARTALEQLELLSKKRIRVAPLSPNEQVERLEKLMARGPLTMARAEVDRLMPRRLAPDLHARVVAAATRLARFEGANDALREHLIESRRIEEARRFGDVPSRDETTPDDEATAMRLQAEALQNIKNIQRRMPLRRIPPPRLAAMARIAAGAGLHDTLDGYIAELERRTRIAPALAFDLAMMSTGVAKDELVLALLEKAQFGKWRTPATFHHANTLLRMGRTDEAKRAFQAFIRGVDGRRYGSYYRIWTEQKLFEIERSRACNDCEAPLFVGDPARPRQQPREQLLASLTLVDPTPAERSRFVLEGRMAKTAVPMVKRPPIDRPLVVRTLARLIDELPGLAPWLKRARASAFLGEYENAADEMHEAYLAWRGTLGRPLRRTGTESVMKGSERSLPLVSPQERLAVRRMNDGQKASLAAVCDALLDPGTAAGFLGKSRVDELPRAYEHLATEAARRHGVDPNLLLAVMRVESVYQRRIISYAGAVGLMQIMPRTGTLIAKYRGLDSFTVDDLLDPAVNLDFAAWYLGTLIDRFDGRLPLAIASYNGGPHNVRRWLDAHAAEVPLEAFLERIPFSQTHRYVRRVLSYYRAYRTQKKLPMPWLKNELPIPGRDPVAF